MHATTDAQKKRRKSENEPIFQSLETFTVFEWRTQHTHTHAHSLIKSWKDSFVISQIIPVAFTFEWAANISCVQSASQTSKCQFSGYESYNQMLQIMQRL